MFKPQIPIQLARSVGFSVRRMSFICFVVAVVGSSILGQSNQEDQIAEARRRVVDAPRITRLDSAVVKVPMAGSKTLPLVEAKLNGKGPYKLLVDTGANVTLLQMRVADELRLPVLRPGETSKLLSLKSIQIGGAHFEDLVVGAKSWSENIDGVIGFNVFANCLLTMDYPRQSLILKKGLLPAANGKDIFTYSLDNRHPMLEILVGNQRLTVLIDTGAAQGIVISDKLASKLRFKNGLVPGPKLSTLDTQSQALIGRLSGKVVIGIHEISEPAIHVLNDDVPLIGSDLFKDFILTFDQKSRTLRITV